jgi:hypothetical protein
MTVRAISARPCHPTQLELLFVALKTTYEFASDICPVPPAPVIQRTLNPRVLSQMVTHDSARNTCQALCDGEQEEQEASERGSGDRPRTGRGGAVQVDPMNPKLKPPGIKRLKLEYDGQLSTFGFNISLRRCNEGEEESSSEVRRCRMTASKPVSKAPIVSVLESGI